MNGYEELALLFYERDNMPMYTPMVGTVTSLPDVRIRLGDRVLISEEETRFMFDICERAENEDGTQGEYIHLGKEVVVLPMFNSRGRVGRFIALGCLT